MKLEQMNLLYNLIEQKDSRTIYRLIDTSKRQIKRYNDQFSQVVNIEREMLENYNNALAIIENSKK